MREYRQYIGGEWIGSAELFEDLDPYRGTVMACIPAGTRSDAARAVDAAAFPAWAEAVAAGARLLTGGSADGPCYRPTVLADVPAGARIHAEETFGPVPVAQPFADADEAVAIANSTRYGSAPA